MPKSRSGQYVPDQAAMNLKNAYVQAIAADGTTMEAPAILADADAHTAKTPPVRKSAKTWGLRCVSHSSDSDAQRVIGREGASAHCGLGRGRSLPLKGQSQTHGVFW